jgi:hypothetical protein
MKRSLIFWVVLVIFSSCTQKYSEEQKALLLRTYHERNYFKLDNLMSKIEFNKKDPDLLLYKSKLEYVFNDPLESNKLINRLLEKNTGYFNDTIIADLHYMKANNADRLNDYQLAVDEGTIVLNNFKALYDSSFIDELKDDIVIWKTLVGTPNMEISRKSITEIPLIRDIAGLFNVPVSIGNDTIDFVFDTGANISVMVKSLASKYGATILKNKVNVYAFTGKKIESELGLINFKFGDIEIKNAVFLIFPDSILSFADGAYIIRGVIGFPVMNALKEFTIKDDQTLIISTGSEEAMCRNLALDDATPVIMVKYRNDTLPFHFDTGADKTILFAPFFKMYKNEIIENCKKTVNPIGGAAGSIEAETYILDSALFAIGNSNCRLFELQILSSPLSYDQNYFYGNFGQDYIKKFSEMKINFSSMNVSFTGEK